MTDGEVFGILLGDAIGFKLGTQLRIVLGLPEGDSIGSTFDEELGLTDGELLGILLGATFGFKLGTDFGIVLGLPEGDSLGSTVDEELV